jgi:hypothetical protein
MKVLGLFMVRDGRAHLPTCLDSMAKYCDWICALDDRSVDGSKELLRSHPAVTNVFSAEKSLSDRPWYFGESLMLKFLYSMADFMQPDWVVLIDSDQTVKPAGKLRKILKNTPPETVGLLTRRLSDWDDPEYPLMGPLMLPDPAWTGRIWRYFPNLEAGNKRLHNRHLPSNLEKFGQIARTDVITIHHDGWNTLARRLEKVDLYTKLDPTCELNSGVPYDKGLLFGYSRSELASLLAEYRKRYAKHLEERGEEKAPGGFGRDAADAGGASLRSMLRTLQQRISGSGG